MKSSYLKDIIRTIRQNAKRFTALLCITMLGITVFNGICAACKDMYLAADRFYDEQQLFDIRVMSTLGLTDDDVEVLQGVQGVRTAEGSYSEKVSTMVTEQQRTADLAMLSAQGINMPYIVEGELPDGSGEIAVTQKYLDDSGKNIGDTILIEENIEEKEETEEIESDETDDSEKDFDFDQSVEMKEEEETLNFLLAEYVITAVVIDPMDVANNEGTTSFRSTATTDYRFFITGNDVETDVYTTMYVSLEGLAELDCYSNEYKTAVQEVIELIETKIMRQQEQARYDALMDEALKKIADAEVTMNEKFADADEQLADAWAEIEEAKLELTDGEAALTREEKEALQQLADGRKELEDGKKSLYGAETELNQGEEELAANAVKLADGQQQLNAQRQEAEAGFQAAEQTFDGKQSELNASRSQLQAGVAVLQAGIIAWPAAEWNALVNAAAASAADQISADLQKIPDAALVSAETANEQAALTAALGTILAADPGADEIIQSCLQAGMGLGIIEGGQQVLTAQRAAYETQKAEVIGQLSAAQSELTSGVQQLNEGRKTLDAGWAEVRSGWAKLQTGEETLNVNEAEALQQLGEAWQELADGMLQLQEYEHELQENETKYQVRREEARQKLADAYVELDDIDMTQWYVQDRTSIDSYTGLDSDLSSIDGIGRAFPILFLIVAILISLTTMTRMVEEERGIIGAYKALGYSNTATGWKYLCYALLACLAGGIIGNIMGFIVLPKLLMIVLQEMYVIPGISLYYDAGRGIGGILLFTISILGATALACKNELRQTPAALMRPKAPRAGSRIILEQISIIWKHLKFLNKVTARNLFRYKKRLLMTMFGIAGCTALVLVGFAIRDSVSGLIPKQYEEIYRYDVMVAANADDNAELVEMLDSDAGIAEYLSIQIETVKVYNGDKESESAQLVVLPDGSNLEDYIRTPDPDGTERILNDDGVLLTKNAADLLGISADDRVALQDLKLNRNDVAVMSIVQNYLGNSVYMTQTLYESMFGDYKPNGAYIKLTDDITDQTAYAEILLDREYIVTSLSTAALKDSFTTDFAILNAVIYGLIVFAAGLAFVVLFTLSNTNISERVRELATIKVLGFFDREVHSYVNKETIVLTLIGVIAGLPFGYVVSGLVLYSLKMPSIQFQLEVQPVSFLISGIVAFSFALVVNLMTNRTLNQINMVEALKSVE